MREAAGLLPLCSLQRLGLQHHEISPLITAGKFVPGANKEAPNPGSQDHKQTKAAFVAP